MFWVDTWGLLLLNGVNRIFMVSNGDRSRFADPILVPAWKDKFCF